MVANSISWAESRGLSRANPVHGKQEFRVPTTWDFANKELNRTTTRATGFAEVEASPGFVELGIGGIYHAHIHFPHKVSFGRTDRACSCARVVISHQSVRS